MAPPAKSSWIELIIKQFEDLLVLILLGSAIISLILGFLEDKDSYLMAGMSIVKYGFLMPYGRTHESEADIVGQDLMARSGFKPSAAIDLWRNMGKQAKASPPEFLSTHPSNQTRIDDLTQHLSKAQSYFKGSNAPNCIKP